MSTSFHPLPIIDDVLAGRFPAPELGGPLRAPLRRIAVADSLEGAEAELVASLDLGTRLAVVGDENTWPVLGARVWPVRSPTTAPPASGSQNGAIVPDQ